MTVSGYSVAMCRRRRLRQLNIAVRLLAGCRGSSGNRAAHDVVTRGHLWKERAEMAGEPFDEIDGPMLAAGAADRDREITAIGADELGNPMAEKACEVIEH